MYDTATWKRSTRGGKDMNRPPGIPTPCHSCPKLKPEDRADDPRPEKAFELTSRMKQVYYYYQLCKADKRNMLPMDTLTLENHVRCAVADEQAADDRRSEMAYRPVLVIPK